MWLVKKKVRKINIFLLTKSVWIVRIRPTVRPMFFFNQFTACTGIMARRLVVKEKEKRYNRKKGINFYNCSKDRGGEWTGWLANLSTPVKNYFAVSFYHDFGQSFFYLTTISVNDFFSFSHDFTRQFFSFNHDFTQRYFLTTI